MSPTIKCEMKSAVATITLNRPQFKNSLSVADMEEVGRSFERAVSKGARCILVRGEGDSFCAGRDLADTRPGEEDTYAIVSGQINPALAKVRECVVPTISAVHGPALGFGLGLALACDITLVADNAVLGSPFRKIGLMLDSGGHYYLRERIGPHRVAELIMTGRLLSGREAAQMGMVNRSVGASELDSIAQQMALSISQGPTAAFRASKQILLHDLSYDEVAEQEAVNQAKLIAGHDGKEGITAFQQKRPPRFIGE